MKLPTLQEVTDKIEEAYRVIHEPKSDDWVEGITKNDAADRMFLYISYDVRFKYVDMKVLMRMIGWKLYTC